MASCNLADLMDYSFGSVPQVCQIRPSPLEGGSAGRGVVHH